MRLTTETHPEGIKRYAHVRRGRGPLCASSLPDTARTCTRSRGHGGPHVAHGLLNRVVAVWDSGAWERSLRDASASGAAPKGRRRSASPIGLPVDRPASWLGALWRRALSVVSSPEELAFLVFFLAFVGFAVYWALLILG